MKNKLFDKINPNLMPIFENTESPIRIVAAPGSGKTEAITLKYLYLITELEIDPSNILLLSFSNKATIELKERIIAKLDSINFDYNTEQLNISTIHSFCKKVIDEYHQNFINKYSATTVLNEISQGSFILSFIEDFGFRSKIEASTKVFENFIPYFNMIADENLEPLNVYSNLREQFYDLLKKYKDPNTDDTTFNKEFREIKDLIYFNSLYPIYKDKLIAKKYIDFSHLQKFLLTELENNNKLTQILQSQFQYILVDEFQDTSYLQSEIILKIAAPNYRITVCGDDDQSLYRFRGATVSNFLEFPDRIPVKVKNYFLDINYRSCKEIVDRSVQLIKNNSPYRIDNKKVKSNVNENGVIELMVSENSRAEATAIANIITELYSNEKISSFSDIVILFRSVIKDSENLLEIFRERNIPYKIFGIDKVATSNFLFSIIDCWKFACGYADGLDFYSNQLTRLTKIEIEYLIENSLTIDSVNDLIKTSTNKEELEFILYLFNLQISLKKKEIKSNISFFYLIINGCKYFHNAIEEMDKDLLSDVAYLSRIIIDIDSSYQRTDPYLISKLFNLLSLKGEDETASMSTAGFVNIMTIHQAKGLEFPVVFMPHQIQYRKRNNKFSKLNLLFHYECKDPEIIQLIDERKIFYVGMTRAKDMLFISYPKFTPWGENVRRATPSKFMAEIGKEVKTSPQILKVVPSFIKVRKQKEEFKNVKLVLSFSKIQTYIECPRKYNLKYNLAFATVMESQLYFGSTLHKCLEEIHKNYLVSKKTIYLLPELEKLIEENWIEITYRKKETKVLKNTALQYLFKYINRNSPKFHEIKFSEKKFSLIDKVLNFEINGIMDLIRINDEGDVLITDFKVNKIDHPTYEKQMHLYAFAYEKTFGLTPKKLLLYSLKEEESKEISFTKNDSHDLSIFLENIIIEIRKENYQAKKGNHCNNCPYYNFCYPN